MDASEIAGREAGLRQELSRAQLVMIGLGGAIGTGLFLGSGVAIGYAGPAVIVSYAIAAIAAIAVVFSLSEMAVVHPTAGSLGTYAEIYLGAGVGWIARYAYWTAQVVAVGGEAVAAGLYMTFFFPATQVWIWSLGFAAVLVYFNSRSVRNFGSIEYWLALIKVIAIALFIVLGAINIFGVGVAAVGLHNLTGLAGGFAPHGAHGIWMAVILGVFSFYGIEVIAVTSGEAQDPVRSIPAALRTMGLRLLLFYVLSLAVVVMVAPWTDTGESIVSQSPFVRVFAHSGIRHAAGIMNFVVLSAAISSMNTNVYLCSRMLFSLARGGYAPRILGRLSGNGTPLAAIMASGGCILLAAGLSKLTPRAYNYLFGIALFDAIIVWMIILASHVSFRRRHAPRELPVRMPGFPVVQYVGFALLGAVLVTMALSKEWRIAWIVGAPWLAALGVAYRVTARRRDCRNI